jgi:formylglycine-generating enzyme required for sulfatase activity
MALSFFLLFLTALGAEKYLLIPLDESIKTPSAKSLLQERANFRETILATRARVLDAMAAGRSSGVEVALGEWWATESMGVKKWGDAQFPEPEKDGVNLEAVYENNDPRWKAQPAWLQQAAGSHEIKPKQVAYFYRTIALDRACRLGVAIGKGCAIALWVNERKVLETESVSDAPFEIRTNLDFEAKTNSLLLKIYNTTNKGRFPVAFNITTGADAYNVAAVWQGVKSKHPAWCERFERDLPGGRHLLWFTAAQSSLDRDLLASASAGLARFDPELEAAVKKALDDPKSPSRDLLALYEKACFAREYLALAERVDTAPLRRSLAALSVVTGRSDLSAELDGLDATLAALKPRYASCDPALFGRVSKPLEMAAFDFAPGKTKGPAVSARYARVEQKSTLSIAEFELMGADRNLAREGKASQSSTAAGGTPERALDGRSDGNWGGHSITHTEENKPGWWEVDLGKEVAVDAVRVWNRTDCCGDRLVGATLLLLGEDRRTNAARTLDKFGGESDKETGALTVRYAEAKRRILFLSPLLAFDRILCIRQEGDPKLPANWAGNSSIGGFFGGNRGAELAVLSSPKDTPQIERLFKPSPNRVIANLGLHWDGERLLFSMPDEKQCWQVYEMRLDTKEMKAITESAYPDIHNFDPCYLPNGKILFSSTRVYTGVPCVAGVDAVANLHLLDPATGKVRRVCFDQEQDWSPTVLNSGKVMYTRWEYTDTAHYFTRILFQMNPDGSGQGELYGSGSFWPNSIFYARPVPKHPTKVVGIVSGHHGSARMGELVVFDPAKARFEADGVVQRVGGRDSNVTPIIMDTLVDASWPKYLHPYPLSEHLFLVSSKSSPYDSWGIWLVDTHGNRQLIKEEKGASLIEPVALRKTPRPPILQDKVQPGEKEGLVYLQDVYTGPGLAGIPRGQVAELRLFTYVFSYNRMGGHQDVAYHGSWDVKAVLGTVPVNPDGSAFFKVPANTPISVQPLDKEGKALQLMRSWFTAMPGETLSCVGCHEPQNTAFLPRRSIASLKEPTVPKPWFGPARGFSFEREVQPVLDARCVGCHNGERKDIPNFSLRKGSFINNFPESYNELHPYVWRPGPESDYRLQPAMEWHADVSELTQLLKKGHHGVKLDPADWSRLNTWIDLNVPAIGSWIEYRPAATNVFDRRREMLKRDADIDVDYEVIHAPYAPRAFIPPAEPKRHSTPAPAVAGWPFSSADAGLRQKQAGAAVTRTVDLGEGTSMKLVLIPPGEFLMGDGSADAPKKPAKVGEAFWMGETEVTLEQFLRFDSNHENGYIHQHSKDHTTRGYDANDLAHPVIRVSWEQAQAFCKWLSAKSGLPIRLPDETRWEWAARCGSDSPFWWGSPGDDFSARANLADKSISLLAVAGVNPKPIRNPSRYVDFIPKDARWNDGHKILSKVGVYQPNPWGLKDMNGNVSEWTSGDYDGYVESTSGGPYRAVRGGSWRDRPTRATASFRLGYRPWEKVFNVGFRVCTGAK